MTRDWAAEWEMEQSELDDLLASMKTFSECEHEWVPSETVEGALSWLVSVCVKCGGGQGLKSSDGEEPLLPDNERGGKHRDRG